MKSKLKLDEDDNEILQSTIYGTEYIPTTR